MKPSELALDRDLLGDINPPRPPPAEGVRFRSDQGHMSCPHLCKPFTTCSVASPRSPNATS